MFRFAKSIRRRVTGLLLLAIIFVQLATAAYACTAPLEQAMQAAAMASMEGCSESNDAPLGMVDPDQPGLCLEHCKSVGGTAELSGTVQLSAVALPALAYVLPLIAAPRRDPVLRFIEQSRPAGSPPLSTLNCCYRI